MIVKITKVYSISEEFEVPPEVVAAAAGRGLAYHIRLAAWILDQRGPWSETLTSQDLDAYWCSTEATDVETLEEVYPIS